ncbi:MAG: 2-oxoacid:acceptor oxidoreductase family protein [Gammaproteobacteria bacterium]
MYRIRFHGRGGQGIKTAACILGTAFFRAGYEVQDAPRYGAERRGAPVFAYVRAAHAPIDERGIITNADLVVAADPTLVPVAAAGVLQGVGPRTVLVINDTAPAREWAQRLALAGPVLTLPGNLDPGSLEAHRIGAICAGTAARLTGAIARDVLAEATRWELQSHGTGAIERSLQDALGAFDAMAAHGGIVAEGGQADASGYQSPDWIPLPLDDAGIAAPDIHATATSVRTPTGLWRTQRPVIDYAHCKRCAWICSTFCPDSAIRIEPDRGPAIDYDHCKGCLVCVAVCPSHAIHAVPEREAHGQPACNAP